MYKINYTGINKEVSSILDRNKNWNSSLVLVDVTGSMFPYTADLLTWLKLNTIKEPKQFVFFNDGDFKNDRIKKIGSTGGIYSILSENFGEVKSKMVEAMVNGGGGDCPENNFEALQEGVKLCSECTDVVMIADNYAYPRDEALLKSYKGNLKIILCGTEGGLNSKYLDLARKYKFSLHTIKSDLIKLFEYHEGEVLKIEGTKYIIKNNKFELLYEG